MGQDAVRTLLDMQRFQCVILVEMSRRKLEYRTAQKKGVIRAKDLEVGGLAVINHGNNKCF